MTSCFFYAELCSFYKPIRLQGIISLTEISFIIWFNSLSSWWFIWCWYDLKLKKILHIVFPSHSDAFEISATKLIPKHTHSRVSCSSWAHQGNYAWHKQKFPSTDSRCVPFQLNAPWSCLRAEGKKNKRKKSALTSHQVRLCTLLSTAHSLLV